jgi:carboxypeptidase Q
VLNINEIRAYAAFVFCFPLRDLAAQTSSPARTEDEKRTYKAAMEDADQKIFDEVKAHSELVKNLEHLTTEIGPRLTGSKQMQEASDWTLKRFRDYGIDAHLETMQVAHSWTRGNDTAEMLSPRSGSFTIHALGWSKSTSGPVTGSVVVVQAESAGELEKYKGKLKGAIVLMGKPATIPTDNAENAYDAVIPPSRGLRRPQDASFVDRRRIIGMIASEQPAAVLLDSGKTDNLYNMGSSGRYQPSEVPQAFVTHEDYSLIYRLAQSGAVTIKVNITGTFSDGPASASITVAEIQGSEHPEERVIIGGHLDSWDLGQGALDNGTGSMAVLEAARTLKALGWRPKRTITFILFTGEEQGLVSSNKFVKDHAADMPKVDAVLVHDTGTGKVFSIALEISTKQLHSWPRFMSLCARSSICNRSAPVFSALPITCLSCASACQPTSASRLRPTTAKPITARPTPSIK